MQPIGQPPAYWHYPPGVYLFALLFWFILVGIPIIRILTKAGHSGWWVLLILVPLVNLIALWVFAFTRWPALRREI